jgi:hypothetical protein
VPVCQQRCQVRYAKNILGMVSFAKSKEFGADLRGIFAASDREQALGIALTVAEKWREKGHEKIASALLRFQDATASADRDAIENAADELITAVTKWVSFSKAHEYRKRLNGVVRRLTSEEPSTKGGQALVALSDHVDRLAPTDPLRAALDGLAGALRANPVVFHREHRSRYAARRGRGGAGDDVENQGGEWEVTVRRTQVRAPQVAGSRLTPFYDDVIIVRRARAGVPEGEAKT